MYRTARKAISYTMMEIDPVIRDYTHMKELPQSDTALHTLKRLASCVKPIMRKRGWRVGMLCEFYPEQANLLGMMKRTSHRVVRC